MSLYIFDKDGTLVSKLHSRTGIAKPPTRPEQQILRPGVFEKLAELRASGHALAIASNQHAVATGTTTLEEAERLVENCAAKVGGVNAWRLSPYDPHAKKRIHGSPNPYARDDESRKPRPGMLLDLMSELGYSGQDTFMVGDSKKDKKAAEAAGAHFLSAKKFFKGNR